MWLATGGSSDSATWPLLTKRYLGTAARYRYIKEHCLEGLEASKNHIRGIFDDGRFASDPEIKNISATILKMNGHSMTKFVRKVKRKLI
jgi:hypothetical protein